MEKKKLSGFQLILIAVTVVVAGGALLFGFLQKKSFDANAKTFKSRAGEMAKIKSMAGYPSQETVDTMKKALTKYEVTLDGLSKDFERVTIPQFTNVSPAEFSSKVSKATDKLKEMFQEQGVELPENWYLGFEKYTSVPAPKNATGILLYNLNALVWLHEELLRHDPNALLNLYRRPASLELEGGETAASNNKSNKKNDLETVVRLPIELSFSAKEERVREFLNAIAKCEKYLFTIDTVKLKQVSVADSLSEVDEEESVEVAPVEKDDFDSLFEDDASGEDSDIAMSDEKLFTQVLGKEDVAVFIDLNLTYLPSPIELTKK